MALPQLQRGAAVAGSLGLHALSPPSHSEAYGSEHWARPAPPLPPLAPVAFIYSRSLILAPHAFQRCVFAGSQPQAHIWRRVVPLHAPETSAAPLTNAVHSHPSMQAPSPRVPLPLCCPSASTTGPHHLTTTWQPGYKQLLAHHHHQRSGHRLWPFSSLSFETKSKQKNVHLSACRASRV